jgi:beta-glucanase (GH16 family)
VLRKGSIALFAFALAYAAVVAAPASAEPRASSPPCGPKAESPGGQWKCTFGDEFASSQLDRSKWAVMTTAQSGFTHATECYVDDPSTVSVARGSLRLTTRKLAAPESCGSMLSEYESGMVHTKSSFAQTYGRFEARIRFPGGLGIHSAWWMWPRDMVYGQMSGEIDIAEHYGSYPDIVSPFVHVKNLLGGEQGRGEYCEVADPEGEFHTYAVEWLPLGGMRFVYDGKTCMTFDNWNAGIPLTYPQPFDQPFFLVLTQALMGWGENALTPTTQFPVTMQVDYVRAWS